MNHNSQLNITCFENGPCFVAQAGLVISWLGHWRAAVTNTLWSLVWQVGQSLCRNFEVVDCVLAPRSRQAGLELISSCLCFPALSDGIKHVHCCPLFAVLMCWALNWGLYAHHAALSYNPAPILTLCTLIPKTLEILLLSIACLFSTCFKLFVSSGYIFWGFSEHQTSVLFSVPILCLTSPLLNIFYVHTQAFGLIMSLSIACLWLKSLKMLLIFFYSFHTF